MKSMGGGAMKWIGQGGYEIDGSGPMKLIRGGGGGCEIDGGGGAVKWMGGGL